MTRTWPEDWEDRFAGKGCDMCEEGRPDENGFGIRFFEGRYLDAYLQKIQYQDGYTVAVWRGRHVAEPTELNEEESAGYWQELLTVGRGLESHFRPAKINYQTLGNALPHLHTHIVPRYVTDSAPGAPLPFPKPGSASRPDDEVRSTADALKGLI